MSTIGGKFVEIDLHRGGEILGGGAAVGDAHRDRLADIAHLVLRQHRLHGSLEPRQPGVRNDRLHAGKIGDGEHGVRRPGGLAYGADARVRQRTAYESKFAHARQVDIGDEFATAAQQAVVFQP